MWCFVSGLTFLGLKALGYNSEARRGAEVASVVGQPSFFLPGPLQCSGIVELSFMGEVKLFYN
jgi:hypothetical protein